MLATAGVRQLQRSRDAEYIGEVNSTVVDQMPYYSRVLLGSWSLNLFPMLLAVSLQEATRGLTVPF